MMKGFDAGAIGGGLLDDESVAPAAPPTYKHYQMKLIGDNFADAEAKAVEAFNTRMNRCIDSILDHDPHYFDQKPIAILLPHDRLEKHRSNWLAEGSTKCSPKTFPLVGDNPVDVSALEGFLLILETRLLDYVKEHPLPKKPALKAGAVLKPVT